MLILTGIPKNESPDATKTAHRQYDDGQSACTPPCAERPCAWVRRHRRWRAGRRTMVLEHDRLDQETEDY